MIDVPIYVLGGKSTLLVLGDSFDFEDGDGAVGPVDIDLVTLAHGAEIEEDAGAAGGGVDLADYGGRSDLARVGETVSQ